MKYFILLVTLLLVSCDSHYRYPCQDPTNWETPRCKKPICDISKDCPEHIFKEDVKKECK